MSAPAGRRRLWTVLKVILALGLLALIARFVPWRDSLLVRGEDGASLEVEGRILGPWTGERIVFQPSPGALEGDLPPELARALAAGSRPGEIAVERGGAFEWRPGMPRVFASLERSGLAVAFAWLLGSVLCTTTRWWRLLAAAGCRTSWFQALRLGLIGFFFNIVVPGLTGGDLVKAVLAARENPGRRAAAAVSVFVDRLIGLFVLAAVGAAVILVLGDAFEELRLPLVLLLAGGVAATLVYSNRTLRRLVRADRVVARLPMGNLLRQVDEAILLYSRHRGTVLSAVSLSLLNHACVIGGIVALARAFGERTLSLAQYIAVVSMGNIASALPIAPAGWGVGEAAYYFLFELLGAAPTLGFAVSVTFRLCLMAIGLAGGLFLLVPAGRAELAEVEALRR